MAFYHFLAIFPALLMLHLAVKHIPGLSADVRHPFAEALVAVLPRDIVQTLRSVAGDFDQVQLPPWRFVTTIAGVLWAGCNGTWAMIYGLNTAYEVEECRRPWELAVTIVGLTFALVFITILALAVVAGSASVRSHVHAPIPLSFIEWVVLVSVLLFWFSILYRFAPSLGNRKWEWSTPGALVALVLWLLATFGARLYFEHFDSYHFSFGRLSGVAMLLVWLYLVNGAILIGGEMNSEIEKAADHRPSTPRKA
jgi:membrane protein